MSRKWVAFFAVSIAAIIGFLIGRASTSPGGPGGGPGTDTIVVKPKPDPGGYNWTVGGEDVEPVVESGKELNQNAFTDIKFFNAKDTVYLGAIKRFSAKFKHCSVDKKKKCSADGDCPTGETCSTSELLLERDGTKFKWTLNGQVLEAKYYDDGHGMNDPHKWRAELCGTLAEKIQFRTVEDKDFELTDDGKIEARAKP